MIRTSESVTPSHPDKQCDIISDAILDEALRQDPDSRVAIEVMGGHGSVIVMGEMTTKAYVDIASITKRITGINPLVKVVQQSPFISQGVDTGGAGDQGIMVGYATNETPELMPLEVMLSRGLCQFIYEKYPFDGKTQVTVEDGKIKSIVASFCNVKQVELRDLVLQWLGEDIMHEHYDFVNMPEILCNPAGDWTQGGFEADTGLTGRKIIVDAYGPRVPIGGGSFSGKDPSKVDRSAAYMARKIAVDLLREKNASEVTVTLAYAIGKKEPLQAVALYDGDMMMCPGLIENIEGYDLTPQGIIKFLDLKQPQFENTATWGHFGRGFKWDI
jgi:S-adenosylmethionine synthetase